MRKLILTNDGTHSLLHLGLNEQYHSKHGALAESRHVFIQEGLQKIRLNKTAVSILEIGLGTGLNAYLTLLENRNQPLNIRYTAVEAFPIRPEEAAQLNYPQLLVHQEQDPLFNAIHSSAWEQPEQLEPNFCLIKHQVSLLAFASETAFDLIYFDAFSPGSQPELWTEAVFTKLFGQLKIGGLLVTYCAKGEVKRNLKKAGFMVMALPGPPGKREMTSAYKYDN